MKGIMIFLAVVITYLYDGAGNRITRKANTTASTASISTSEASDAPSLEETERADGNESKDSEQ